MAEKTDSNKEAFKKLQKYKISVGVLALTSAIFAFTTFNLSAQLQESSQNTPDVEVAGDFPFAGDREFIPGSGGGGGSRMASDRLTPVLDQLVADNDITTEQEEIILDAFNSYDPFN